MKKAMIKLLLITAMVGLASGAAFADADLAWTTTSKVNINDSAPGGGSVELELSPNVSVRYRDDGGTGGAFTAGASNSKGSKTYGITSTYTGIKMTDGTNVEIPDNTDYATETWANVGG